MKHLQLYILLILLITFETCNTRFELNEDIHSDDIQLLSMDSTDVDLGILLKNKISLVAFIYTNCPDICPMTTHNMKLISDDLEDKYLSQSRFIIISFDPDRDTPDLLYKYAKIRNLVKPDWYFLTGDKENIRKALNIFNVIAAPTDTSYGSDGKLRYNMIHTDRISLVDKNGKLRNTYKGSEVNRDQLIQDIIYLGD